MSRPILLVLTAVTLAPTLQAQSNPAYPDSGRRVRVTLAGASAVIGVVTDISDSGLTLRAEDGIVMVPRASITRLDLSQGMRRNTARGIQRGSLIGAAAGAVVGALAWADEKPNGWFNLGAAWCRSAPGSSRCRARWWEPSSAAAPRPSTGPACNSRTAGRRSSRC